MIDGIDNEKFLQLILMRKIRKEVVTFMRKREFLIININERNSKGGREL